MTAPGSVIGTQLYMSPELLGIIDINDRKLRISRYWKNRRYYRKINQKSLKIQE